MGIYVITHKDFNDRLIKNNEFYKPLLVGVDNGNVGKSSYLHDNIGDNISKKNDSFCELTGIYWVWKNCNDDIVGFDHYRRYFVDMNKNPLSSGEIINSLNEYDAILPKKESDAFLGRTASQYFGDRHDPLIWTLCRDIIKDKYPSYIEDFDWYSYQMSGYSYNMIITKNEIMNEYNQWLFDILFELDSKVDLSYYTGYNQRMWGFVSERLINVWLHHQDLRIKEYPVAFVGKKNKLKKVARKIIGNYWKKTHSIFNGSYYEKQKSCNNDGNL